MVGPWSVLAQLGCSLTFFAATQCANESGLASMVACCQVEDLEPELQCDVQMTRNFFTNKAVAQIQQMHSDHLNGPSTHVHNHFVLCLEKVDRYCPGADK